MECFARLPTKYPTLYVVIGSESSEVAAELSYVPVDFAGRVIPSQLQQDVPRLTEAPFARSRRFLRRHRSHGYLQIFQRARGMSSRIRPIAIGIFRRDDEILVGFAN